MGAGEGNIYCASGNNGKCLEIKIDSKRFNCSSPSTVHTFLRGLRVQGVNKRQCDFVGGSPVVIAVLSYNLRTMGFPPIDACVKKGGESS